MDGARTAAILERLEQLLTGPLLLELTSPPKAE
jgi:hypothetical protein